MTALWKDNRPTPRASVRGAPRPRLPDAATPVAACIVGRFLGTVIVTLHGPLDLPAATSLREVLRDLVDGQGNLAVVIDLRDVSTVHAAGVDALAHAAASIARRGGELRLGGPSGQAFDAIALGGLARLVAIPFEEAHRAWVPPAKARASERAARDSHPARRWAHDPMRRDDP